MYVKFYNSFFYILISIYFDYDKWIEEKNLKGNQKSAPNKNMKKNKDEIKKRRLN